ncbi:MAG: hypothetical protein EXR72_10445 [Myxococcales bacterium]|nr:hypothetical protein [Myxococcales bacterium]
MSIRIKHEFVVVPARLCASLDAEVDELRRAQVRAQGVAFDALPAFYRDLHPWRALAHHLLPGARRSFSRDAAAVNLGAALAERTPLDWSWVESMAHLLGPAEAAAAAAALAKVVRDADGPCALVMDGMTRDRRPSDAQQSQWRAVVAAQLAWPDGADSGEPGEFVEYLRALCAALHDAASRGDGLLYLSYSPELIPSPA